MRAFLTGCNGYIGGHLSTALKQAGWGVVGLDRAGTPSDSLDEYICCDLLDTRTYARALENCSTVFHLAAAKGDWGISNAEYERDNVAATEALITNAGQAGPKHWLHYSTVAVLGPSSTPLSESAERNPQNAYGATKAACEELFESFSRENGDVSITIIRPSAVFGPAHPANTNLYRLIDAIEKGRFLFIGDGSQRKTTSFIHNLIDATMFLSAPPQIGVRIFHYVDNPTLTMEEMVAIICERLGRSKPRVHIPLRAVSGVAGICDFVGNLAKVDLPITKARIEKFCTETLYTTDKIREMGFQPEYTIEQALSEAVENQLGLKVDQAR